MSVRGSRRTAPVIIHQVVCGSELCWLILCDNVKLDDSKYPPLPGETWIIPAPPSSKAAPPPPPYPTAQQTQLKLQISSAPPQPLHAKPMIHFQLLMPNLPNSLSLCGVYRLEGEERREMLYPTHLKTRSQCTALLFPHPTPPSQHIINTYSRWYTHTNRERAGCFSFALCFLQSVICAEGAVKVG